MVKLLIIVDNKYYNKILLQWLPSNFMFFAEGLDSFKALSYKIMTSNSVQYKIMHTVRAINSKMTF